jgi:hypothetical protein
MNRLLSGLIQSKMRTDDCAPCSKSIAKHLRRSHPLTASLAHTGGEAQCRSLSGMAGGAGGRRCRFRGALADAGGRTGRRHGLRSISSLVSALARGALLHARENDTDDRPLRARTDRT